MIKQDAVKLYEAKEAEFANPEQIREIERVILLKIIDQALDGSHRRYGSAARGHRSAGRMAERSCCRIQIRRI